MILCLLRHGHATDEAARDDWRTLTWQGRQAVRASTEQLRHKLPTIEKIFVSPLARAIETATLAADALTYDEALEVSPLLQPGGQVQTLATWIERLTQPAVLMVSHEPILGNLVGLLTGRSHHPLAKAEVVGLERTDNQWKKLWSIAPPH